MDIIVDYNKHMGIIHGIIWYTGWWYTYPSEKYESTGIIIPNIRKVIEFHGSKPPASISFTHKVYPLPILDTLQKMTNSLLLIVDIPINTKRLKD
jgi:hypothetical protein